MPQQGGQDRTEESPIDSFEDHFAELTRRFWQPRSGAKPVSEPGKTGGATALRPSDSKE